MTVTFRPMRTEDWILVAEIYKQGIEGGNVTFRHEVPGWQDWDKGHLQTCRLVAEEENIVIGWAALSPVSSRAVYKGVAEVSIYVSEKYRGQKIGTKLLEKLIVESEKENLWTLQARIFPENIGSLKIHKGLGFREVGYREKIGKMNGVWRDIILLERRSKVAGID
jgi:phosphinothricin acetyltransferase